MKALTASGNVSINLVVQFTLLLKEVQQEALTTIAAQHEPAKELMREAVKKVHVGNNSGNNEWHTLAKHIKLDLLRSGLDPIPKIVLHPPLHNTGEKKPSYQIDSWVFNACSGSSTWARTRDLRINSPALYQLSY